MSLHVLVSETDEIGCFGVSVRSRFKSALVCLCRIGIRMNECKQTNTFQNDCHYVDLCLQC